MLFYFLLIKLIDVTERLEKLEKLQNVSVDSTLDDIHRMLASKSPFFIKDLALEYLLNLKMVAKETKHPKAGFYSAVFEAVKEKTIASDERFRKYIQVLLGDKDQEKVLQAISKVDKMFKEPSSSGRASAAPGLVPNRRSRFADIRCYYCRELGHHQSHRPVRGRGGSLEPPAKTGKWGQSFAPPSK